jgi:hypothetical protein
MRIEPTVALALILGTCACSPRRPLASKTAPAPAPLVSGPVAEPEPPADLFQSDVKPLLLQKCSPCHAPGGQMYARMPFDDPATVREHQAGIVRRLKAEGAVIERWLAIAAR